MNFDSNVQNKTTEFICKHGDTECRIVFNYDIEDVTEIIESFETILKFLSFNDPSQVMKEYYNEE